MLFATASFSAIVKSTRYTSLFLIKRSMSNERESIISKNLKEIKDSIPSIEPIPRLVAVSKFMPAEDIQYAFNAGQTHFGENYVQELVEKSEKLPKEIDWHFIGHLQSNKCKAIAGIENLFVVETIDSEKKADALNKACKTADRKNPLKVYVQINTSGEDNKSGVEPTEALSVCKHIKDNCESLELYGLMTIGAKDRTPDDNPDFKEIMKLKDNIKEKLDLTCFETSFGMSSDYKEAIKYGSNSVRVGSAIFGSRPQK